MFTERQDRGSDTGKRHHPNQQREQTKLEAFVEFLKQYGIVELCRDGNHRHRQRNVMPHH